MSGKVYRSKCCNAKVRAWGMPDFLGSKEVCTVHYVCRKCNKPCDLMAAKGQKRKIGAAEKSKARKMVTKISTALEERREILTVKKRIRKRKKRLDFKGEILQKLVELLDGITIHPIKGVILTPKKKRQLIELQNIEQRLFQSKQRK